MAENVSSRTKENHENPHPKPADLSDINNSDIPITNISIKHLTVMSGQTKGDVTL
jgi:hypothetical protein